MNNVFVAEFTIDLMLNTSRNIAKFVTRVKRNFWKRKTSIELTGKMLGLIGCASIGREVVRTG